MQPVKKLTQGIETLRREWNAAQLAAIAVQQAHQEGKATRGDVARAVVNVANAYCRWHTAALAAALGNVEVSR